MRTLRLMLTGMAIVALLGGLGGAVLAQSEDAEPTEPTGVVITQANLAMVDDPQISWMNGDAFGTAEGGVMTFTWDATDPRLSGTATASGRSHVFGDQGGLEAWAMTLTNDVGRWVGTGRGIVSEGAEYGDNYWLILEGEDGHEGLTAYLTRDFVHDGGTIRGFIFPGEMPAFPKPSAE